MFNHSKVNISSFILIVLFIFTNTYLIAQNEYIYNTKKKYYFEIEIHYKNGTQERTLIGLPITNNDNHIFSKKTKDSKKQKIDPEDVDYLIIDAKDGRHLITREKVIQNAKKKKVPKYKSWVSPVIECENFTAYEAMYGFTLTSKGNFSGIFIDNVGTFCIKRSEEDYPTKIGVMLSKDFVTTKGFDKQRLMIMKHYYDNDPKTLSILNKLKSISEKDLYLFLDNQCQ